MTRKIYSTPVAFVVLSSLVFSLGAYVLTNKTTFRLQFFISSCGEALKNITDHVHINPEGLLSFSILLIAIIGISLTIIQVTRFIFSHKRLSGKIRDSAKLPDKLSRVMRGLHLQEISVSVVGGKPTAYTIGLFQPQIVISRSLIQKASSKQLEAVVLHEFYHFKNHHLLWLLISRLVSSLFFFIPLIEYLAQQLKTEFELTADSYVVSKQKTRDHLCGSLMLNLQYARGVIPHFATSPIEKRVESLLFHNVSFDKISTARFSFSLLSIALMIGVAMIQPAQIAAGLHNDSEAVCRVGEECINKDCSDVSNTDSLIFSSSAPVSFSLSSSY